jgi:hypothetical protein
MAISCSLYGLKDGGLPHGQDRNLIKKTMVRKLEKTWGGNKSGEKLTMSSIYAPFVSGGLK